MHVPESSYFKSIGLVLQSPALGTLMSAWSIVVYKLVNALACLRLVFPVSKIFAFNELWYGNILAGNIRAILVDSSDYHAHHCAEHTFREFHLFELRNHAYRSRPQVDLLSIQYLHMESYFGKRHTIVHYDWKLWPKPDYTQRMHSSNRWRGLWFFLHKHILVFENQTHQRVRQTCSINERNGQKTLTSIHAPWLDEHRSTISVWIESLGIGPDANANLLPNGVAHSRIVYVWREKYESINICFYVWCVWFEITDGKEKAVVVFVADRFYVRFGVRVFLSTIYDL